MAAAVGRESYLSEVEVIFTRLPRRRLQAPATPTSEMPLPLLADAMRLALRTVDWEDCEEDEEDEAQTERTALRPALASDADVTEPMIDLGAMVADCSGCTAPMPQQTLAHALHMAAAMRVRAPMPRLSPVPVAPRVQQPAAMRAPAPMPRRSGFTASLLLSLTFFVAAAAALAGALYF